MAASASQTNGDAISTDSSSMDDWMRSQPLSILQLDPADRIVLKIAGNAKKPTVKTFSILFNSTSLSWLVNFIFQSHFFVFRATFRHLSYNIRLQTFSYIFQQKKKKIFHDSLKLLRCASTTSSSMFVSSSAPAGCLIILREGKVNWKVFYAWTAI